jgi:hypothetical protein
MCALNQGAHTSFPKKKYFGNKIIRMSLVLEYDWQEAAILAKQKHTILTHVTWENSLTYHAWQLSFQLKCPEYILEVEIHYPHLSRWNKHDMLQLMIHWVEHRIAKIVVLQFECLCPLLSSMGPVLVTRYISNVIKGFYIAWPFFGCCGKDTLIEYSFTPNCCVYPV